jgi:hypothetical protein
MESSTRRAKEKEHEGNREPLDVRLKNRLFFINKFYVGQNTMEGIVILEHDENGRTSPGRSSPSKGVWEDGVWWFYQSFTSDFDGTGQMKGEPQFADEEIMSIPESPSGLS